MADRKFRDPEGPTFLPEFELYVMLAILRLESEAYGAAIRREIEARADRPVSIGALYATLGRMGEKGLVVHRVSDPLPVKGGRARKYYRLTARGEEAVRHSVAKLDRMREGLSFGGQRSAG